MKFTVERRTLVKILEVIGRKAPSKTRRDKEVRLSACASRIFAEANESAGGTEALVLKEGSCLVDYKIFLKLLKTYSDKKNLTVEVDEHRIRFATTTLPVMRFSSHATPPGNFKTYPVTDDWLTENRTAITQTLGKVSQTKLPNADKAIIEKRKISDYLINPEHHVGASKANFFSKFGFCVERWEDLATALRIHGQDNEVKEIHETGFGLRYKVEGKLTTPDGRTPYICSVWQFDKDSVAPRLITAYPLDAR